MEQEFRRYLECGIVAHGFARAFCDECQHDFLMAYSCKGRGECTACNARRMVETAECSNAKTPTRWALGIMAGLLGLSVDASVRVEANDRPGLERLLR